MLDLPIDVGFGDYPRGLRESEVGIFVSSWRCGGLRLAGKGRMGKIAVGSLVENSGAARDALRKTKP